MGASGISRRFHWHSLNGDGRYYSDASNFVSNLTQQELMQSINDDEILIQSLQETLKGQMTTFVEPTHRRNKSACGHESITRMTKLSIKQIRVKKATGKRKVSNTTGIK